MIARSFLFVLLLLSPIFALPFDLYTVYSDSSMMNFYLGGISLQDKNITTLHPISAFPPAFAGISVLVPPSFYWSTGNDPALWKFNLETLDFSTISLPDTALVHSLDSDFSTKAIIYAHTRKSDSTPEVAQYTPADGKFKSLVKIPFQPSAGLPSDMNPLKNLVFFPDSEGTAVLALDLADGTSFKVPLHVASVELILFRLSSQQFFLLVTLADGTTQLLRVTDLSQGTTVPVGKPISADWAPVTAVGALSEKSGAIYFMMRQGTTGSQNLMAVDIETGTKTLDLAISGDYILYTLDAAQ